MGISSNKKQKEIDDRLQKMILNINVINNQPSMPNNNSKIYSSINRDNQNLNKNESLELEAPPPAPSSNNQMSVFNTNSLNQHIHIPIENSKRGSKIVINNSNKSLKISENNNIDNNNNMINNNNIINNNNSKDITPDENVDNNLGGDQRKYNNNLENENTPNKKNIDPNIEQNKMENEKKETPKYLENIKNRNMNFGGKVIANEEDKKQEITNGVNYDNNMGGQIQYLEENNKHLFTKTGDYSNYLNKNKNININDEKYLNKQFTNTGKNIDNNISASKISNIEESKCIENPENNKNFFGNFRNVPYNENDLELSQSIFTKSFSDLNLNDPKDIEKFKIETQKKFVEGYFPIFLKLNNDKPKFFYLKFYSTLKHALKCYYLKYGFHNKFDENITLYNGGNILDQEAQIMNLNIPPLSVITNHA